MEPNPTQNPDAEVELDTSLQEELANYKAQLEEFSLTDHPELEDPDKLAEAARDSLIRNLPTAVQVLSDLLANPKPETRMSAAKFIVNAVLGKRLPNGEESLEQMFDKLQKHPAAEPESTKVPVAINSQTTDY